ncbi:MAG: hypothetical protein GX129_10540 [Clostridiales bacterium]|jgi:hypothetical protein|nr:hypothetical protein [Clostridiales bacterium]
MIVKKRKIFIIATFLVIAAIAVVLCVGYFTEDKKTEFDGVLAINSLLDSKL